MTQHHYDIMVDQERGVMLVSVQLTNGGMFVLSTLLGNSKWFQSCTAENGGLCATFYPETPVVEMFLAKEWAWTLKSTLERAGIK